MPLPLHHTPKSAVFLFASCIQLWNPVAAQNFTTMVGESIPFSLGGPVSLEDRSLLDWAFGLDNGIKGNFITDLGVSSTYDSNFRLEEDNTESELITIAYPRIRYQSDPEGGAPTTLSASYLPLYRTYLDNSDLNGLDQSGDISIRTIGSKTVLTAFARYSEVSATDRFTRDFVTGSLLNLGISGTYQIAPRTLLSASTTFSESDYSDRTAVGSDIFSARFGALWASTERLSIGPSIRYNLSNSDNTGDIESWAAFIEAQYRAGERIRVVASIGVEQTSAEQFCSCELGLTGGLSAIYAINERWRWNNSIRYVTIPSPTEVGYVINNFGFSTILTRELLRGSIAVGLDLNLSDYERIDELEEDIEKENNLAGFVSYNRPLFTDRLDFQSVLRYTLNEGGEDWTQLQLLVGLLLRF
jgi:hypothetical protein